MNHLKVLALGAIGLSMMAAPCFAQSETTGGPWYAPTSFYGNLGYSNLDADGGSNTDVSAVIGRVGARFGPYLGVEGEASAGIGSDSVTLGPDTARTHLDNQYAGYLVGFLPVTRKFDFLARVGYGAQQFNVRDESADTSFNKHYDSVNYGAGAQYLFTDKDGVRVDYTRYDSQEKFAPDQDVWSVAYVRKF